MPYEVFLAFRYLRSRHKRGLARATSIAAILGICMGVAALIVAFALSNGFRDEMREKILQGTAHLSVLRADGRPIENHAELARRLREVDGVVSASATTYDGALARGRKDSGYAVIRGIENEGGQFAQATSMVERRFVWTTVRARLANRRSRTLSLAPSSRPESELLLAMFCRCCRRVSLADRRGGCE